MSTLHVVRVAALLALSVLVTACQKEVVRPDPPPPLPPVPTMYHQDATSAVNFLAKAVAQQLSRVERPLHSTVPVDEFFSVQSAEVSTSGRALQRDLAVALSQAMSPLKFVPLDVSSANSAQWV